MLGESLYIASKLLTQEAKVASLTSKMEALEKENYTLKKKLIDSMDEANTSKLLLLGPSRLSSKLTSTTQCSSVGTLKVLSF